MGKYFVLNFKGSFWISMQFIHSLLLYVWLWSLKWWQSILIDAYFPLQTQTVIGNLYKLIYTSFSSIWKNICIVQMYLYISWKHVSLWFHVSNPNSQPSTITVRFKRLPWSWPWIDYKSQVSFPLHWKLNFRIQLIQNPSVRVRLSQYQPSNPNEFV